MTLDNFDLLPFMLLMNFGHEAPVFVVWDNFSPPWVGREAVSAREHGTRTRGANRSDTVELAKRERLTGQLRAVAPWRVNGSDR